VIPSAIAAVLLVIVTILVHYEALRFTSQLTPALGWIPLRARLIVAVCAAFSAHTVEVWIWGLAYYVYIEILHLGAFGGIPVHSFLDFVYFSAVSYTSLGLGDVYPHGGVRLLTGVEALVGLLMIAWSASFTYLAMEKFWPMHRARSARPRFAQRDDEQG
jgi:hypothetical protein